jgi:hypothetical protein
MMRFDTELPQRFSGLYRKMESYSKSHSTDEEYKCTSTQNPILKMPLALFGHFFAMLAR